MLTGNGRMRSLIINALGSETDDDDHSSVDRRKTNLLRAIGCDEWVDDMSENEVVDLLTDRLERPRLAMRALELGFSGAEIGAMSDSTLVSVVQREERQLQLRLQLIADCEDALNVALMSDREILLKTATRQ